MMIAYPFQVSFGSRFRHKVRVTTADGLREITFPTIRQRKKWLQMASRLGCKIHSWEANEAARGDVRRISAHTALELCRAGNA